MYFEIHPWDVSDGFVRDLGAAGIIFGRNLWQRSYDEALALSRRVHDVMARYPA